MKGPARGQGHFVLFSRLVAGLIVVTVFGLVGIQFAHIVGRNLAMIRTLHGMQADVKALRARKRREERTVVRLSDPAGAIPEIHERLHLVGPRETLIYLRGAKPSSP